MKPSLLALWTLILGVGGTALAAAGGQAAIPPAAPAKISVAPLIVSEVDNGKTRKLGEATTVTIALAGNVTTGYSWAVAKVEGDALQQTGDIQYSPDRAPAGMVGSGGMSKVSFRAVQAGQTTVTLAYARPWERSTPPARSFQVTLIVEKDPASNRGTAPPAATAPGGPATPQANIEPEKAIEKYIRDKGGPGLTGRVEACSTAELNDLFADYTFTLVTIPRWPVARLAPAPLALNNVFAVDGKGAVRQMTTTEQLQSFFVDKLAVLKGEDQVKAATAWATLAAEFFQDGMFKFLVGKPEMLPTGGPGTSVRVVTTVDPAGGNRGDVTSTLSFDPSGKFQGATDGSTLKAGMRPICQATKLLDSDPLVRRMAEQDLLVMGRGCLWYLEMMREGAAPELQAAIDTIKGRILRDERIDPRRD